MISMQDTTRQPLCPLLGSPLKDCYCVEMNSNKVQFALRFCGGAFQDCRIFQSYLAERGTPGSGRAGGGDIP